MRHILLLVAFTFSFMVPAHAWEAPPYPTPKLMAVEVWAQWCPNCKILDPKLEEARKTGQLDDLPVLFVKLDYTDKTTINQTKMQGKLLGLEPFMKANGSGTGYVALLDADTKEELASFTRESSSEDMIKTITEKLGDHSEN